MCANPGHVLELELRLRNYSESGVLGLAEEDLGQLAPSRPLFRSDLSPLVCPAAFPWLMGQQAHRVEKRVEKHVLASSSSSSSRRSSDGGPRVVRALRHDEVELVQ